MQQSDCSLSYRFECRKTSIEKLKTTYQKLEKSLKNKNDIENQKILDKTLDKFYTELNELFEMMDNIDI